MIYAAGSKGDCSCGADENKGDTAAATVRQKKKTTTTTTRRAEARTGVGRDEDEEEAPPSPPPSSPLLPDPVSLPPSATNRGPKRSPFFLYTDFGACICPPLLLGPGSMVQDLRTNPSPKRSPFFLCMDFET